MMRMILFGGLFLCASLACAQSTPTPALPPGAHLQPGYPLGKETLKWTQLHYVAKITVPKSKRIETKYADLFPGERKFGGCGFRDLTKPGSYMPIIEHDSDHVIIEAPPGHIVERVCDWWTPKKETPKQ